jgi:ABC-type multidrug transport system ATPase subunit
MILHSHVIATFQPEISILWKVRIFIETTTFRQQFRYVPEEPYLYTRLSDLEYLMMVAQLGDMPRKTARGVEAET